MNNKFKVTFITKASEAAGLGHFNRSKILAEEMIKLGHQVNFYVYGKIFKYGPVKKPWILSREVNALAISFDLSPHKPYFG